MITPSQKIDALWFEQGTAADAAAAINATRAPVKWVSPARVRDHWKEAQRQGRLPPFERPPHGFNRAAAAILKFLMTDRKRKAA